MATIPFLPASFGSFSSILDFFCSRFKSVGFPSTIVGSKGGKGLVGAVLLKILGLTFPETQGLLRPEPKLGLDFPERFAFVKFVLDMSQAKELGRWNAGVFS